MRAVALTIAGSDPSGGAGIQADLKTFHQFGVYGEAVITLITVQNTTSVSRVEMLPEALVLEQIAAGIRISLSADRRSRDGEQAWRTARRRGMGRATAVRNPRHPESPRSGGAH